MFHTYDEAIKYIEAKRAAGIRFDLVRMKQLMEELKHPEQRVKTIHVAGSNGKGSTVKFLQSILTESDLFVGSFMSPVYDHLEKQIAINGEAMPKEDLMETLGEMKGAIDKVEIDLNETISEFELMTALALYYFSFKKPVDIAIIEAGMGGGHDATNVIVPLLSIITNVTLDHQQFLGESIEEIANEKAGIIKSGVGLVTGAEGIPLQIIKEKAAAKKAKVYAPHEQFHFTMSIQEGEQRLSYEAPYCKEKDLEIGMLGQHQGKNAALAVTAVTYLKQFYALMVDSEHIRTGLKKASLPGRFEIIRNKPTIILDSAHNPAAMEKTVQTVMELYPSKNITVLFAAMMDKDIEGMLALLNELTDRIAITSFEHARAADRSYYDSLKLSRNYDYVENLQAWRSNWERASGEEDLLLMTGSNFLVEKYRK